MMVVVMTDDLRLGAGGEGVTGTGYCPGRVPQGLAGKADSWAEAGHDDRYVSRLLAPAYPPHDGPHPHCCCNRKEV